MKKTSIKIFSLFAFLGLTLQAQEVREMSLSEVRAYALENSFKVKHAQQDIRDAKMQVRETQAIGLPQINAEVGYNDNINVPQQVFPNFISPAVIGTLVSQGILPASALAAPADPEFVEAAFGTKYSMSAGVTASLLLFDGSYFVGLQAAKAYKELVISQKSYSEEQVLKAVSEAYYTLIIAQENVKLLQTNYDLTDSLYQQAQKIYAVGLSDETSVDQIALNLKRIEAMLSTADQQLDLANNLLRYQMGMADNVIITPKEEVADILQESKIQLLLTEQYDVQQNSAYQLADQGLALRGLDVKNYKARAYPQLSTFFTHSQNAYRNTWNFFDFDKDWFPTTIWGVKLNIPIFSSLQRSSQVQRAKIAYNKAELDRDELEMGLKLQVAQAKVNLNAAKIQYDIAQENYALADKIYKKGEIQFTEGTMNSVNFTQLEQQMITAQSELMQAILNVLNASNEVEFLYQKLK